MMRDADKIWHVLCVLLTTMLLAACASPITYPVRITYTGEQAPTAATPAVVGLQLFQDARGMKDLYQIGSRAIGRGQQERYVSSPENVAVTVSDAAAALLQRKGLRVEQLKNWDLSPESMARLAGDRQYLLAGEIRTLRCAATRRFAHTNMQLDIELVLYIGRVTAGAVDRRPIDIHVERIAPKFGPAELGQFLSESLSQLLEKGLADLP
jgi:hypothetical protein